MSYHLPVLGANTTAVKMMAPVWKILDQPMYSVSANVVTILEDPDAPLKTMTTRK
jgi:hypothetical protein